MHEQQLELDPPPARATYLREAMGWYLERAISGMLDDLAGSGSEPSTGSWSVQERLLMATLRPLVPKLHGLLRARLCEADPAGLERLLSALATELEAILANAPGEPEPRMRFERRDGRLALVPDLSAL